MIKENEAFARLESMRLAVKLYANSEKSTEKADITKVADEIYNYLISPFKKDSQG